MKQLQKKNSNIYRKFSTDRGRSALKFWSSLFKEWLLEESKVVFTFCRNIYGNYFSPCIFGSFSSSFLSIQTASHLVSLKKVKYNLRPYLGPWGIYISFSWCTCIYELPWLRRSKSNLQILINDVYTVLIPVQSNSIVYW